MLERNDLLAAGLRAIRPAAVRVQAVHFVAGDLYRVALDRAFVRPVDRGALRGAERGLLRVVEAHAGVAQTMRQSATTNCRIIMLEQSVVCAGGNRAIGAASSLNPRS